MRVVSDEIARCPEKTWVSQHGKKLVLCVEKKKMIVISQSLDPIL